MANCPNSYQSITGQVRYYTNLYLKIMVPMIEKWVEVYR
jgi:hypothetical protein